MTAYGITRPRTRKDGNQAAIVQALREAGALVYEIEWPVDLLVVTPSTGVLGPRALFLEVKSHAKATLRASQAGFLAVLPAGMGHRVETPEQALELVK